MRLAIYLWGIIGLFIYLCFINEQSSPVAWAIWTVGMGNCRMGCLTDEANSPGQQPKLCVCQDCMCRVVENYCTSIEEAGRPAVEVYESVLEVLQVWWREVTELSHSLSTISVQRSNRRSELNDGRRLIARLERQKSEIRESEATPLSIEGAVNTLSTISVKTKEYVHDLLDETDPSLSPTKATTASDTLKLTPKHNVKDVKHKDKRKEIDKIKDTGTKNSIQKDEHDATSYQGSILSQRVKYRKSIVEPNNRESKETSTVDHKLKKKEPPLLINDDQSTQIQKGDKIKNVEPEKTVERNKINEQPILQANTPQQTKADGFRLNGNQNKCKKLCKKCKAKGIDCIVECEQYQKQSPDSNIQFLNASTIDDNSKQTEQTTSNIDQITLNLEQTTSKGEQFPSKLDQSTSKSSAKLCKKCRVKGIDCIVECEQYQKPSNDLPQKSTSTDDTTQSHLLQSNDIEQCTSGEDCDDECNNSSNKATTEGNSMKTNLITDGLRSQVLAMELAIKYHGNPRTPKFGTQNNKNKKENSQQGTKANTPPSSHGILSKKSFDTLKDSDKKSFSPCQYSACPASCSPYKGASYYDNGVQTSRRPSERKYTFETSSGVKLSRSGTTVNSSDEDTCGDCDIENVVCLGKCPNSKFYQRK